MSIIDSLTAWFTQSHKGPEPKPLPPTDIPHALGALLVRIAKADAHYAVQEIGQIDRILGEFQNIGPVDAAKFRADCERLEAVAPDTSEFTRLLCKSVPYADRLKMVEALWDVVYADTVAHHSETQIMEITQSHLGISAEDCAAARSVAQSRAALPPTT